MKRTLTTLLAALFLPLALQAQTFVAGVKGGLASSHLTLKDIKNDPLQYAEAENIVGYHAGAFMRLQVLGVLLQPEAILSSTGGKVAITDIQSSTNVHIEKVRFTRLDVPLLLGYNFLKVARVQAGPVASSLLTARQDGDNIKDYFDRSDWGYQAGLGVDIWNITFDVRYENISRKYTDTSQQSGRKFKNEQLLFSLGFKLIK